MRLLLLLLLLLCGRQLWLLLLPLLLLFLQPRQLFLLRRREAQQAGRLQARKVQPCKHCVALLRRLAARQLRTQQDGQRGAWWLAWRLHGRLQSRRLLPWRLLLSRPLLLRRGRPAAGRHTHCSHASLHRLAGHNRLLPCRVDRQLRKHCALPRRDAGNHRWRTHGRGCWRRGALLGGPLLLLLLLLVLLLTLPNRPAQLRLLLQQLLLPLLQADPLQLMLPLLLFLYLALLQQQRLHLRAILLQLRPGQLPLQRQALLLQVRQQLRPLQLLLLYHFRQLLLHQALVPHELKVLKPLPL